MSLLDRHLGFVEALREAGLPVSLAEGLDAVQALGFVGWDDRETVRDVYAATLLKREVQRPTFDTLFDLWFPRLVGEGVAAPVEPDDKGLLDTPAQIEDLRSRAVSALETDSAEERSRALADLAVEAVGRLGRMPGRAPNQSGWSAYTTMRRVGSEELVNRLLDGMRTGVPDREVRRAAADRVAEFQRLVEAEAMRRIAAERDLSELGRTTVRPSVDRLDFTAAKRDEIAEMRRALLPLARRLAARLTKERHSQRRGPLDFRRTVRASISTGGVPVDTRHRPKRPHRTDLVVLCDVSGSVANFAQFTLMLVFALREQFTGLRAFTFVDDVEEVTDVFTPGADPADVLTELAARSAHASRFGRTNYGAAFRAFEEKYADALGPRSTLLVLGDARSNYADLHEDVLAAMAGRCRQSYWLNPEHRRHWGAGDSAAWTYGEKVPMTECRNLVQLGEFVHDLV